MNVITVIILAFAVIGAADWLMGNKFGLGGEFEKGFSLFCPMALSMLGMLVIAPAVGVWMSGIFDWFYTAFGIDPSVIPASLLANDMGGTTLAESVCVSEKIGKYNAFVISSMMGCTISFTLPFSIGLVKREQYNELFLGILCGITTIPVGSFVAGLVCGISATAVLLDLLPLIAIAAIIGLALIFARSVCIRCFALLGQLVRAVCIVGLVLAIFTFLTKITVCEYFDSFENAAFICANACVTLSGMLPFMSVVSRVLRKPLKRLGASVGINEASTVAFLATLITSATTFGTMDKMDKRGAVLNSAFAVSAAFTFGGHLAFTMAFDGTYVLPMITGKIVSGVFAVLLAFLICREKKSKIRDR